jgi:hypothetical protein
MSTARSFTDTESGKNTFEQIIAGELTRDFPQRHLHLTKVFSDKLTGRPLFALGFGGVPVIERGANRF